MTSASMSDFSNKISPAFAARLAKLDPSQEIRAIVLPVIPSESEPDETVARSAHRRSTQETIARIVSEAFPAIDRQLASTGGRRLTKTPNRLGFILIAATSTSIFALAAQDWVKAIVEDQPLFQI